MAAYYIRESGETPAFYMILSACGRGPARRARAATGVPARRVGRGALTHAVFVGVVRAVTRRSAASPRPWRNGLRNADLDLLNPRFW